MTLKEIYQALIEGKRIRMKAWHPGSYLYLKDDEFVVEDGTKYLVTPNFSTPDLWEIYEEPEDLDSKIQMLVNGISGRLDSFILGGNIETLIDLKIKKAQLK
jgi:hypothetical protein